MVGDVDGQLLSPEAALAHGADEVVLPGIFQFPADRAGSVESHDSNAALFLTVVTSCSSLEKSNTTNVRSQNEKSC